ncbi:STAS domain-containing protein [Streptomyces xanthochromogenes]|uniref:STAS domain-containing protein n=1 Tax=Streptomyces xanthochromogenes TaxID=67384 RepID=UPI00343443DF
MTTLPIGLHLVTIDTQDTVRIEITGDLDYQTVDLLLDEVTSQLDARPGLKDLHLHFAEIGSIDSMGLSVLLMIHRRTAAAGTRLHLDDRPPNLNRLLDVTGTLEYLTAAPPTGAATSQQHTEQAPPTAGTAQAARPTGPDSTT